MTMGCPSPVGNSTLKLQNQRDLCINMEVLTSNGFLL